MRVKQFISGEFTQNLMAYGASEAAAKLSRLLVVVAVSRTMGAAEIGVAAAALAAADILKSLTENGVGQRIIAASDKTLAATCSTAHKIFWVWAVGLFTLQTTLAGAIWVFGGSAMLAALLALLAVEYLFMPGGLVQAALAMRAGKMKQTAAIAGSQVVGSNLLAACLAVIWPSALVMVLPRVLAAPYWLMMMRRLHAWSPSTTAGEPLTHFIRYGAAVLGVELVKALRLQVDKLVIGALMGAEVLGLYFMAFNASLGLATSFSVAFSTVLFPHLCSAENRPQALRQSIILGLSVITPVVLAQSLLAPIYVPILFGDGWEDIAGIVSILCLVAIPTTLWSTAAGWMRVHGRPQQELWVTTALTVALIINTVLAAPMGLAAVATGYLAIATVLMVAASLPTVLEAFQPKMGRA